MQTLTSMCKWNAFAGQIASFLVKTGAALVLSQSALWLVIPGGMKKALAFEEPTQSHQNHDYLGTELDALPFVTGGYYFSLIGGREHFRLRAIVSLVNPPEFAYPSDQFSNLKLHVYAAVLDYFFKPDLSGFWVGTGLERWFASVDSKNGQSSGNFQEWVATLGVGYVWYFYSNFYLNPWVAGHLRVGGDSQSLVGSQIYAVSTLQGEGSVKLGWHF